ncbi:MAG: hypothetical protein HOO67_06660 [Candidatus Peribacteraceae bacterium]|nr:hypothetical protein [Candidatus Peribacteraceae bacterium]
MSAHDLITENHVDGTVPEGLRVIPDFVDKEAAEGIQKWTRALMMNSCHCQEYDGMRYVWCGKPGYLEVMPKWSIDVRRRLMDAGVFSEMPNSLFVIRYQSGASFAPHVDEIFYGPAIAGLSLGAACEMPMVHTITGEQTRVFLPERSMYVLNGEEARFIWKHGIPPAVSGTFRGQPWQQTKPRFSYTFRLF